MRLKRLTNVERGQVSFESILLWVGFLAVLGLFLPVFAHSLEAQKLQLDKEHFLSFAHSLEQTITRVTHYSEGSSVSIRVPQLENLEIEIQEKVLTLTWSPPALSDSLIIEIESPLPFIGEMPIDSGEIIISRESASILIESG